MPYQRVKLSEILFSPRKFVFSFPTRESLLLPSLKCWGLLEPPIVAEGPKGWWPVCGEGRLLAARKLSWETIEVRVWPSASEELLWLSLESNLFRGLNLVEKAEVVSRFKAFLAPEEVAQKVLPRLELPPSPRWYFFLERLAKSPEKVKWGLVEGRFNPKTVEALTLLSPPEQEAMVYLWELFRFTHSEQREVFQGLQDLARRKDQSLLEVIKNWQKLESKKEFLEALRKTLKPHFFEREKKLKSLRNRLSPEVLLESSPSFEKDEIQVSFKLKGPQDLEKKIQLLLELKSHLCAEENKDPRKTDNRP